MFYWVSSVLTHSYALLDDNWPDHVRSKAFDDQCIAVSHHRLSSSGSSDSSVHHKLFQDNDTSSPTYITSSVHNVPKLEKHFYYFDTSSDSHLGPKLIYRTSKDKFMPPTGPENDPRPIWLLQVNNHAQLGKDNLWATVHDKVCDLLEV